MRSGSTAMPARWHGTTPAPAAPSCRHYGISARTRPAKPRIDGALTEGATPTVGSGFGGPGVKYGATMSSAPEVDVTAREQEVLGLLSEGLANKEIADALGCSVRTVEFHISNLLRKVGVTSRLELVARGRRDVAIDVAGANPESPLIEIRVFSGLGAAVLGDTIVYMWSTP